MDKELFDECDYVLSDDDYDALIEELDQPAKDNPKLRRLLREPK